MVSYIDYDTAVAFAHGVGGPFGLLHLPTSPTEKPPRRNLLGGSLTRSTTSQISSNFSKSSKYIYIYQDSNQRGQERTHS